MQDEKSIILLYLQLRLARDITTDFSREARRRYSQVLTVRDFFLKPFLQYPSILARSLMGSTIFSACFYHPLRR